MSEVRVGGGARDRLVRTLLAHAWESSEPERPDAPEQPSLTLADAAERAAISRPSVAAIRDRLESVLAAPESPRRGQRVGLDPAQGVAIAIEIRQREVTVCTADLHGRIVGDPLREEKEVTEDPRTTLDRAARMIDAALLAADRDGDDVVGIGISLAHPVDPRRPGTVRVLSSSDDPGWQLWQGLGDVREQLRGRLAWRRPPHPARMIADNDANLSAFAERGWAMDGGLHHALYLYWGEGIGSGLIVNGEVDRGLGGIAGAVGHMPSATATEAPRCNRCGLHGCLETVASGAAIFAQLGMEYSAEGIEELLAAAREPGSVAAEALDQAAFEVGRALGFCLHVLNPEAIIIGGPLGFAAYDLVRGEGLERGLRRHAAPSLLDDVNVGGIRCGRFPSHTALRGAIARVLWDLLPEYLETRASVGAR